MTSVMLFEQDIGSTEADLGIPELREGSEPERIWGIQVIGSQFYIIWRIAGTLDTGAVSIVDKAESQFHSLADQWRRETGMLSSINKMVMHPAYQRIIGMGAGAIVPILRELQRRPDHWFWALSAITGENPVPQECVGNLRQMADAWTDWGRKRGYLS